MPKLKHYQIKHVVNATKCDSARARRVFSQLFPELDIAGKVRKMSQEQYKVMCKAIVDPQYMKALIEKKTKTVEPAKEPAKETPKPVAKEPEKKPEPQKPVEPEPAKPEQIVRPKLLDLTLADITNESDRHFIQEAQVLTMARLEQKHLCDTVLKQLIAELDEIKNQGKTRTRETRGAIWSHIYTTMRNRHGIDLKPIAVNQHREVNEPERRQIDLLVQNRLVTLAIKVAKRWLEKEREKLQLDHLSRKSHNPEQIEPTMSIGSMLGNKNET